MAKEMDVHTLKARLEAGGKYIFVDVREPHEFEEYNLGAKLIPLQTLPDALDEFGDSDTEIILHCRSGARSGNAQRYLESQGYTNVTNVSGGVLAWREAFGE